MEQENIFIDKKGRTIVIDVNNGNIEASFEEEGIGEFIFEEIESNNYDVELVSMDIKGNFERAGIGTAIMEYAIDYYGIFLLPRMVNHWQKLSEVSNPLEDSGKKFIAALIDNGTLDKSFADQYNETEDDIIDE